MIYVVLGMHKSGTTLVSEILHHSGVSMGDFDSSLSYDDGNTYERDEMRSLNKMLLGSGDAHSLQVIRPLTGLQDVALRNFQNAAKPLLEAAAEDNPDWGFKDPRTVLTYDIWRSVLPEHRLIVVFRRPEELWRHYTRRISIWRPFRRFWEGVKAIRAWCIYNSEILRFLDREERESLVISFAGFMSGDETFRQLEAFIEQSLVDMRKVSLYRNRSDATVSYRFCEFAQRVLFGYRVVEIERALSARAGAGGQFA